MKCNQWTLGLAAVGLVSLASVARADSTNAVMTALNSTTLSGYVDTSASWNLGTHNSADPAPGFAAGGGGHDGFNLDVVDLQLQRSPDATDGWGAGYTVELWLGPQANALASQSTSATTVQDGSIQSAADFAVKNAYVELKAPLGNGLDAKIGVFDTIIGYEVADGPNNPNFTRSYGFGVEPTTHTGILLAYTVNDMISLQGGIADSFGPTINRTANDSNSTEAESMKTYMGSVSLTAPKDWGFIAGSTLYACVINGFDQNVGGNQTSFYAGATVNTPLKELKVGASYDYVVVGKQSDVGIIRPEYVYVLGGYATYQLTEKLSLNARGEYGSSTRSAVTDPNASFLPSDKVIEGTLTAQYDLWKNVLSRIELRWDHDAGAHALFGGGSFNTGKDNAYAVLGNIVYKF